MLDTLINFDWPAALGVAAAFVLAFDRLAKLTPTKKDDETISKLYRLFAVLGLKIEDNE
jgi:hypothetical protein